MEVTPQLPPPAALALLRRWRRATAEAATNGTSSAAVPEPVVKIDNETDPFATIVSIEFGDRLGELLDTVGACLPARPPAHPPACLPARSACRFLAANSAFVARFLLALAVPVTALLATGHSGRAHCYRPQDAPGRVIAAWPATYLPCRLPPSRPWA